MCGIVGFVDYKNIASKESLDHITDKLARRGPDDRGTFFNKEDNYTIGLGHRRLSILDLSKNGKQPMSFQDLQIIFNGEIYNFREVRKELIRHKYVFNSDTDTEVILKAFHCWGPASVKRFVGMFSYAIYSSRQEKIYLFRDRAGVKPFYYYKNKNALIFSSELKALANFECFDKNISNEGISDFFSKGWISGPYSIYKDVFKLMPGTYAVYKISEKSLSIEKYWDIVDFYQNTNCELNYLDAQNKVEELLKKSLKYRMVSDVPVGTFLSGGYDSSLITALLVENGHKDLNTFTIGFSDQNYDESHHAKAIAEYLGTDHQELICTSKELIEKIDIYSDMFDEPFSDVSSIPMLLLSEMAREKVTVSLSADGGDELFAGYEKYAIAANLKNKYDKYFLKRSLPFFNRLVTDNINFPFNNWNIKANLYQREAFCNSTTPLDVMRVMGRYLEKKEEKYIFKNLPKRKMSNYECNYPDIDRSFKQMMSFDFQTYLRDEIMVKVDRSTMFASLEGREPLLDHNLIEFVASLPTEFHFKNHNDKSILKDITHKYIPKSLLERPKHGFSVPIGDWLKNDMRDIVYSTVNKESIKKTGLFNESVIISFLDDFYDGKKIGDKFIWNIFVYFQWQDKWL
tara:strand:+ start:18308 stop:20194 length:1887 start_codon:yes stop_codon:yes gene_type:complete